MLILVTVLVSVDNNARFTF